MSMVRPALQPGKRQNPNLAASLADGLSSGMAAGSKVRDGLLNRGHRKNVRGAVDDANAEYEGIQGLAGGEGGGIPEDLAQLFEQDPAAAFDVFMNNVGPEGQKKMQELGVNSPEDMQQFIPRLSKSREDIMREHHVKRGLPEQAKQYQDVGNTQRTHELDAVRGLMEQDQATRGMAGDIVAAVDPKQPETVEAFRQFAEANAKNLPGFMQDMDLTDPANIDMANRVLNGMARNPDAKFKVTTFKDTLKDKAGNAILDEDGKPRTVDRTIMFDEKSGIERDLARALTEAHESGDRRTIAREEQGWKRHLDTQKRMEATAQTFAMGEIFPLFDEGYLAAQDIQDIRGAIYSEAMNRVNELRKEKDGPGIDAYFEADEILRDVYREAQEGGAAWVSENIGADQPLHQKIREQREAADGITFDSKFRENGDQRNKKVTERYEPGSQEAELFNRLRSLDSDELDQATQAEYEKAFRAIGKELADNDIGAIVILPTGVYLRTSKELKTGGHKYKFLPRLSQKIAPRAGQQAPENRAASIAPGAE